jgi:antitoxin (DNA-binding transcriptional repressor) of toxin-antitoxin stability system
MHTVTVRELRNNFAQIAAWLEAGETLTLTRRGKVLGRIEPELTKQEVEWPDFAARHRELWGENPELIDSDALFAEMRKERF